MCICFCKSAFSRYSSWTPLSPRKFNQKSQQIQNYLPGYCIVTLFFFLSPVFSTHSALCWGHPHPCRDPEPAGVICILVFMHHSPAHRLIVNPHRTRRKRGTWPPVRVMSYAQENAATGLVYYSEAHTIFPLPCLLVHHSFQHCPPGPIRVTSLSSPGYW